MKITQEQPIYIQMKATSFSKKHPIYQLIEATHDQKQPIFQRRRLPIYPWTMKITQEQPIHPQAKAASFSKKKHPIYQWIDATHDQKQTIFQ